MLSDQMGHQRRTEALTVKRASWRASSGISVQGEDDFREEIVFNAPIRWKFGVRWQFGLSAASEEVGRELHENRYRRALAAARRYCA